MGFIPVNISDDGEVVAVEYHGSAHISSLPAADGIIAIASGLKEIEKGKPVNVILI
jgi:molybdopterin biosynthesis enzyme